MKGTVAAVAVTGALFGCGGGGGGPENAAAPVHVAKKTVVIDMEGDSLIWGAVGMINGVAVQSPNNPPTVVQALLQSSLGPTVTTLNNAVPGTTVANSLAGQGYPGPLATRLASNQAQIVLSDYAMNDCVQLSLSDYTDGMNQWIQDVRAAGKIPVLEEPNPSYAPKHANLGAYRDVMVSIAKQQNVLLITQYDYILSLPNWQSLLQTDGTHPTDALYKIKAENEAAQLRPLISSLM